jgi:Undecaprenyl-phosphate glucose phosphotransferase
MQPAMQNVQRMRSHSQLWSERTGPVTSAALRGAAAPFFAGDWRTIVLCTLRVADIAVIVVSGVVSYAARHDTLDVPALYWWQILAGCIIATVAFHYAQVYTFTSLRQRSRQLGRVALIWAATALVMIAALFFAKVADEVSRLWLLIWGGIGLAALVGVRLICWLWVIRLSQAGKLMRNVAVVGPRPAAENVAQRIEYDSDGDVRVLGIFHTASDGHNGEEGVERLAELSRSTRVDEVMMAFPCVMTEDICRALHTLGILPTDVKLCLDFDRTTPLPAGLLSPQPLVLCRRPLSGWQLLVKRTMDVTLSLGLLVIFAPLMALLAMLVKLDSPGPCVFRQRRFGFNKQPFTVFKFRTMYCDDKPDPAVPQARRGDLRVTRFGRFLRRHSLDELPQLFNVVFGTMSLVGPRPHAIVHDERYAAMIDGYFARHRVLPGITGWAQVNGFRGETDTTEKMARRIEHDLFYIEHWTPFFDLRILMRTLRVGFANGNAY